MKYSTDLRERVLSFIEEQGSKSKASLVFKVGRQTIYTWLELKRVTGSVQAPPLLRKPRKYDPEELRRYVEQHPDAYLKEIAPIFHMTPTGVYRALKKMRITRKKKPHSIKNAMKS